jgi:hypothetical protein
VIYFLLQRYTYSNKTKLSNPYNPLK